MNNQELIKAVEELPADCRGLRPMIDKWSMLELIKLLDEPKPVKVPPSVAVWYEINKDNLDKNIACLCLNNWGEFINDKTLFNWMSNTDNFIQILVNMHQFGYEIEKEKWYLVKFKGFNSSYIILKHHHYDNTWFLGGEQEYEFYRLHHTRKQLEEAGFGWVFDCPGIEIEEVE